MIKRILKYRPWESQSFQDSLKDSPGWKITTMLMHSERRMLAWLGEHCTFENADIADLGSFLGGSAAFLAYGARCSGIEQKVHSYDFFELGDFEKGWCSNRGVSVPADGKTYKMFLENTRSWDDLIVPHKGDITNEKWHGRSISILFVDVMKSPKTYDHVITEFMPHLVAGRSIVVMQDYLFPSGIWHYMLMEALSDHFEYVSDTHQNSALFFCDKVPDTATLHSLLWDNVSDNIRLELVDQAIQKLDSDEKKEFLIKARKLYLESRS